MIGTPNSNRNHAEHVVRDRVTARREAAKAEIVAAAWDLAREHGVAGFSLRDLARRVGMKAPSLYEYFDSKNAIYDAMFADGSRAFGEQMESGLTRPTEAREAFRDAARRFAEFCTADPARYQLLFQRPIPEFEPSPESYALAVEAYEAMRERFTTLGLTEQRHLDLWTSLSSGVMAQQLANDPGGDRFVRLFDDVVDMFVAYVLPESETPDAESTARRKR